VGLFLGARFRVDAPNVLFRIGISSFFHLLHSKEGRRDCKRASVLGFPRRRGRQSPALPFLVVLGSR
jgi:hypothetical protein